jgi:hypothetical protein
MIRVSIDVGRSVRRFRVTLCAQSIEQAVDAAKVRYPGSEVQVTFPIDPEAFFAEDAASVVEDARIEVPASAVG